jgi:hypothetical protein
MGPSSEQDGAYSLGQTEPNSVNTGVRRYNKVLKDNSKVMIISDCLLRVAPREVHD